EAANAMLHHGCKSRLKIAFSGGGQHLKVMLKTVGCCSNLGFVSFEIHIAGICEQSDCVGGEARAHRGEHCQAAGAVDPLEAVSRSRASEGVSMRGASESRRCVASARQPSPWKYVILRKRGQSSVRVGLGCYAV